MVYKKKYRLLLFSGSIKTPTLGSTVKRETRQASFPTGTVGPLVWIFLSPLNTNDGFYLSHTPVPALGEDKKRTAAITDCHRSASHVMSIGDHWDGFFYPTLTLMIKFYSLHQACILSCGIYFNTALWVQKCSRELQFGYKTHKTYLMILLNSNEFFESIILYRQLLRRVLYKI